VPRAAANVAAQGFLGTLAPLKSEKLDDLELITLISRIIEIWLQNLFFYLVQIPEQSRPYMCEGSWEDMYLGKFIQHQ
jgi:hypothetical protein